MRHTLPFNVVKGLKIANFVMKFSRSLGGMVLFDTKKHGSAKSFPKDLQIIISLHLKHHPCDA